MCANASNFQQSELELRDFGCSYKTLHILSWNLTFDNQSFSPCIYIIVFFWTFSVPNKPTKHGRVRRRAGTTADHVMHNIIISRYLPSLNFSMYTAFLKTIKNGSFRITIWYTTLLVSEIKTKYMSHICENTTKGYLSAAPGASQADKKFTCKQVTLARDKLI